MHEWAMAESILLTAMEEADKRDFKKILDIKVSIGELQQIENDIFSFALNEIKKQHKKLRGTDITIETEESLFKCKICGNNWGFNDFKEKLNKDESESIHFIPEVAFVHSRCPKCGSPDFEIEKGRGVSIISITGEK
jgi:hydrogenase nickel incorporation protein HypA/HybF